MLTLTTALGARVWTNYIVDLILVAVLVGFALVCAKKGFIECFFSFVSVIAALLAAILLSKIFISILDNWFNITGLFTNMFQSALLKIEGFDIDISVGGLTAALADKNLPKFLIDLVVDNFGNENIAAGTTLALLVGETLSKLVVSAIAFVVLFIGAKFLMKFLKKILKFMASKIKILGAVDQLLGAAVGLIEGLLVVSAVLGILAVVPSEVITSYVSNSIVAGWLYNYNILNVILGWISH